MVPNVFRYYVAEATYLEAGHYKVTIKSDNDCGEATIEGDVTVGIIDNNDPTFKIQSVQPNPVHNEAVIQFILPTASDATFTLIDLAGKPILELFSDYFDEGENTIHIYNKLTSIASGTYFVLLESHGRKAAMKITINK